MATRNFRFSCSLLYVLSRGMPLLNVLMQKGQPIVAAVEERNASKP